MAQFTFQAKDNKVFVTDISRKHEPVAEISYYREIKFNPSAHLSREDKDVIKSFAKYDNICDSLEKPYEKVLKPVGYDNQRDWSKIKAIIQNITGGDSILEFDNTCSDLYITNNENNCRKLCSVMNEIGVRTSIQTDLYQYCAVIYSNLINQIDLLDKCILKTNN